MDPTAWDAAGAMETLGEDIMALEAHRVELDKGRQGARQAWRALQKEAPQQAARGSWVLTDVGMFVKTPNTAAAADLKAEQERIAGLLEENRVETKAKLRQLAALEGNSELMKEAAVFESLKPMARGEACFNPNAEGA